MSDEIDKRDERGRWKEGVCGNPRGQPRLTGLIRELLAPHKEDIVDTLIIMAKNGDTAALRIYFERVCPPLRADSESVEVPGLAEAKTLTDKANAILNGLATGNVSPDAAAQMLAAIASAAQLTEVEELKRRLAALESRDLA